MNPKNPQAASEGFVRIRESVVRHWVRELNTARNCDSPAGDICERLHSSILAALSVLAAAPAIAPGGDDTSTGDDARHARENPPCLPEPTLLYQHDGDGTKVYGYTAAQMIAALPAAGNAVDDAMVERAHAAYWASSEVMGDDRPCMRAALTAALAPAARSLQSFAGIEDRSHEIQFNDGLDDSPADPPAAGDGLVEQLASSYADHATDARGRQSWEFDEHGLAEFAAALLAAQEAAK